MKMTKKQQLTRQLEVASWNLECAKREGNKGYVKMLKPVVAKVEAELKTLV